MTEGIKCPYCGNNQWRVVKTLQKEHGVHRRKECRLCGTRITTGEKPITNRFDPRV